MSGDISAILPSRGRPDQLEMAIRNLAGTAAQPSQLEILVGLDADDEESIETMRRLCKELPLPFVSSWVSPQRFGYARLHEYVNFLAGQSVGDWLMLWNDDAVMVTDDWDAVIREQPADRCLFMNARYPAPAPGNIFPVWPRDWYTITGHVSLSANCDVWVSEVARRLGAEVRVPIEAVHERCRDEEADATHAEGRMLMGEGNAADYDSAANRMARTRDVRMIRFAMEHRGQLGLHDGGRPGVRPGRLYLGDRRRARRRVYRLAQRAGRSARRAVCVHRRSARAGNGYRKGRGHPGSVGRQVPQVYLG